MNILKKKNITNVTIPKDGVVMLEFDNGTYSYHSNTVWSVHKDPNNEAGEDQTSGMLYLYQDGAGGSMGYFGHWISPETPLVINGIPAVTSDEVEEFFLTNLYTGGGSNEGPSSPVVANPQIEVGTSQVASLDWDGKTVIFTDSCTITIPAVLVDSYIFNGVTLLGVTVTLAIVSPKTWVFGTPFPIGEKKIFSVAQRGKTNNILILGV